MKIKRENGSTIFLNDIRRYFETSVFEIYLGSIVCVYKSLLKPCCEQRCS